MTPQNIKGIIENIKGIIASDDPENALRRLDEMLPTTQTPAELGQIYAAKGKILWRLNRRGEAISAYETGIQIDPAGPCAPLLDISQSIMEFFNKDLLNP